MKEIPPQLLHPKRTCKYCEQSKAVTSHNLPIAYSVNMPIGIQLKYKKSYHRQKTECSWRRSCQVVTLTSKRYNSRLKLKHSRGTFVASMENIIFIMHEKHEILCQREHTDEVRKSRDWMDDAPTSVWARRCLVTHWCPRPSQAGPCVSPAQSEVMWMYVGNCIRESYTSCFSKIL